MNTRDFKRFTKYVQIPDEKTGCMIWTSARRPAGYGQFYLNGRSQHAHRLAYEHFIGPIPNGLTIDHLCRNPSCVNPTHLEAVTDRVNILRGEGLAAKNAIKTHCDHGHEFTVENTYWNGDMRQCRTCQKGWSKQYRTSKKGSR